MNRKVFFGLLVIVMTLAVATAGCTFSTNSSSGGASPSASASSSGGASPSASAAPQNITGYATYTNSTAGVRLQYPSGWNVKEGGSSTRVVQLLSGSGSNVIVVKGSYTGSLEDAKNTVIGEMLNVTTANYTLVSTEKTTLAGLPAYNMTFTATYLGQDVKQVITLTTKDNYYYDLTFSSSPADWNQDQNVFSNIFNSFAITS